MREIRRCPACLTYIYSDARTCHGCGERLGRRRILTRGSWIFIVLAAAGFAIGRGVDLEQEKTSRIRSEFEELERADLVKKFVTAWMGADAVTVADGIGGNPALVAAVMRNRNQFPSLPRHVEEVKTETSRLQRHAQFGDTVVPHGEDPIHRPPGRRVVSYLPSVDFEARVLDGPNYRVRGQLCLDGNHVRCVTIGVITGPAGEVIQPAN